MRTVRTLLPILLTSVGLLLLGASLALTGPPAGTHAAPDATLRAGLLTPTATPTVTPTGCGGGPCFAQSSGGEIVPGTSRLTESQCDDCALPLTLPFAIQIGSSTYITAQVVSNGHIDFEKPDIEPRDLCLPTSFLHTSIFIHGDDLDLRPDFCGIDCGIYTSTTGTAPNRTFNVEWRASLYANHIKPVNFEIRFYEAQPTRFDMIYGVVTMQGIGAAVGVQDSDYSAQFECRSACLTPGLVLRYTPPSFTDVPPGSTFYNYVRCVYCRGAVGGYPDGTFKPINPATRGQMTKILVLAFGLTLYDGTGQTFSDVPTTHTFYRHIETAARANIVGGYGDGTFRPDLQVTRAQLSKIIVIGGTIVNGWSLITPARASFTDVAVGSTFYNYIETAACHQIIGGYVDGTFRPLNGATRGQISKIVCLAAQNQATCSVGLTPTAVPAP